MALYKTISLTGTGSTLNSQPYPVNWRQTPFNLSLGLDTGGSTTGFTVQYCFENPNDYASATLYNANATWFSHANMSAKTADTDGNIAFPVHAIRLQANTAGTDTATLTITQGN